MKIYLAGPEVFAPDALGQGAALKAICTSFSTPARGPVIGLFPLDNQIDIPAEPATATATATATAAAAAAAQPTTTIPATSNFSFALATAIRDANMALIHESDAIIANMAPFRGPSMDVGTAYEMGVAAALGKIVVGYTADRRDYVRKVLDIDGEHAVHVAPDGHLRDRQDWAVEDFAAENPADRLLDNLMMTAGGALAICASPAEAIEVAVRAWDERKAAGTAQGVGGMGF